MNNKTSLTSSVSSPWLSPVRTFLLALVGIIGLAACLDVHAANGTWTNAPVSGEWTNVLNWNALVVPGTVNNTANNGVDAGSIATFTNPVTTYGTVANPIIPDDGTIVNGKARMMGQLNFDGPNCGAYVFNTLSAYQNRSATQPETGVMSLCVASQGTFWNGSFIGASVVNPQTFLLPVQIRLPSSTTGQYGFTNNATSPLATYFFNQMWLYPDATGRGVTFVLSGSNTGTNTIAMLSQSSAQTAGNLSNLRKEGSGRWILSGTNNFNVAAIHNINDGTLEVQNVLAFGLGNASVNSNGVLQVDGVNLNASTITLQGSGKLLQNGSCTINGITVGTAVSPTTPILATTGVGGVMTLGTAVNKVTGGAANSVLHVAGPGTVLLSYANNYIGRWSVDSGTLQIASGATGALGTGLNLNIAAGAIFDVTPYTAGSVTYNPGTAGIGGSGTGTAVGSTAATIKADPTGTIDLATGAKTINLTYTPTTFTGDLTHSALYVSAGTLSLGGNAFSINNASGTALGAGTYKLIEQASGSITSAGGYSVIGVTGSGVAANHVASIVVSGGEVDLVVAPYISKDLVWSGTGNIWDNGTTADWLNGVSASVFNNSDNVTFNSVGSANPTVSLASTLSPGNVVVSNVVAYTFTGSGSLAGGASLTKAGPGTLTLSTVNTYGGGTVISNGVLQVGIANAIPSIGSGNVSVISPGTLDLNAINNDINGLNGSGTVDTVAGGSPVLTIGNNASSGTFSGVLKNTAGTLNLTKVGAGTETLTGANTFSGATTMNLGVLVLNNLTALGSSALTVNAGSVDVQSSLNLASLAGAGGGIANSTANPVTITVNGSAATTFSGFIWDGAGGGNVALKILGTTSLTLGGNNTYTGGTIVGSGATMAIPNSPAAVGGFVIASNLATLSLSGGSGTPGTPTNILTVDGATVSFASGALGKIWGGQFQGSAGTTNRILNVMSFGGDTSFKNFYGVVNLEGAGQVRFINIPSGAAGGGDAATFNFPATGAMSVVTRDPATVRLGSITGGNNSSGIDQASGGAANVDTYLIGGKNVDCSFQGYVRGSNNIVKIGSARLTLAGGSFAVIGLDENFNLVTNSVYTNLVSYLGNTTISNGVLALAAPALITNSPVITLASASAILDASKMGYPDITQTNLVINGIFEVVSGQTLAGIGTIRAASVLLDAGSIFNVGLPLGSLTATNTVELAGLINMNVNITNTPNSSSLLAQSFIVDGTASLVVTNRGPENYGVFQLFNHPVNIPSVTLPTLTGTNVWVNNLAVDGSITLVAPVLVTVNTNSTNITATASGGNLTLTWPSDHTGWRLQTQTNSLTVGIATNWVDVAGATATNQVVVPISTANGSVFFRMVYP